MPSGLFRAIVSKAAVPKLFGLRTSFAVKCFSPTPWQPGQYQYWQQLAKLDLSAIAADFPNFIFSSLVRDLGVTLDQELTFAPHIHRLCRDSYYQLRQLRTVIRSLTSESTATLIHAFIAARLDYCSSLYAGLPVGRLRCLDRVLRTAARLSGRIPKFGHVSRYMLDVLHWLPLQQRIS